MYPAIDRLSISSAGSTLLVIHYKPASTTDPGVTSARINIMRSSMDSFIRP